MAITHTELLDLEVALKDRPDGVSMRDLVGVGAPESQRRAMQRRLSRLIFLGRARSEGERRWTRYFATAPAATPVAPPALPPPAPPAPGGTFAFEGGPSVPLSSDSAELQRQIQRPELERNPVGYNRDFLSSYEPNRTFYLPQRDRDRLRRIGAVDPETRPAGTFARHILDRLLIDLSFNSSRLEGNTYSLLDTHALIERGKEAEGKSAEETAMIMNHKSAIEFLVEAANEIGFNRHTLLNLHALLAENLLAPEESGRLRQHGVGISRSVYNPPQNPQIIDECFSELLAKANAIADPLEQSFFVTIQLPYLQPFADVNKRVSRLAANIPFIKRNLTPVSFIDVPDVLYIESMLAVYELNRIELARDMFVWAYERSARRYTAIQQSIGSPDQFRLRYREQLRAVVSEIIRLRQSKTGAELAIALYANENVPEADRRPFVEAAQAELIGLHEGNFARYRVLPSDFFAWKAAWESGD